MRTKGDTFAPLRTATRDVRVGKYVLPKGKLWYEASLQHVH